MSETVTVVQNVNNATVTQVTNSATATAVQLNVTTSQTVNSATVSPTLFNVTVASPGPQGIPGTSGASFYYEQTISVPTASFTITHNLGKPPNVAWIDSNGHYELPDVTNIDNNNVALLFPAPVTGTVVCS